MTKILFKIAYFFLFSLVISPVYAGATYNNVYMSYFSPKNVTSMVNYAKANQLGGLIIWEFRGDVETVSPVSLLNTAVNAYGKDKPMIMGYWSNWSIYSEDDKTRAIPEDAYRVPGSLNGTFGYATNQDFTDKLEKMNVITYGFLEAQAKTYLGKTIEKPNLSQIGTLYFNDPWGDLFANQTGFCNGNGNTICWYAPRMQHKVINSSSFYGNFEAFAKLKHSNPNNPLGPLKKIFSVGGYGHNETFEDMFDAGTYDNFVGSANAIITHYKLDGIDLDYENPSMTHAQSQSFATLVQTLRTVLGPDKLITVTILAAPDYLDGSRNNGTQGFNSSSLQQIANVADRINLMTYDFHGAFDYDKGKGRTGFLTNLVKPTTEDVPKDYDAKFSVENAVKTLKNLGISPAKINIGIPAYGRALTSIPSDNGGLYQIIPDSTLIPRGDLDAATCTMTLPLMSDACSGAFQYKYIISKMLGKGFTETDRQEPNGISNGTTAYATEWSVPDEKGYTLKLINNDPTYGFNISIYDVHKDHQFGPSDYMRPGHNFSYNKTSYVNTKNINGQKALTIHWDTTWGTPGSSGDCGRFDFTQDTTIQVTLSVDKNNNLHATCTPSY